MRIKLAALGIACYVISIWAQELPAVYNVTVIEHNLQAVNYRYQSGATRIDLKGTVLLPAAKGSASVTSRRGRTEIDAKLDGMSGPRIFGREYLCYVLWAISPEGAPHNLGEVAANGSGGARFRATTGLQAFALMMTAEPYAAVRGPSNVVVMENQVRAKTMGRIEPIQARPELFPRGSFVLDKERDPAPAREKAPKAPMAEFEEMSQIQQAENALAIARMAGADRSVPDVYAKAQRLLNEAKDDRIRRAGTSAVVQCAREAAQTADDARTIAMRRVEEEKLALAIRETVDARKGEQQARADLEDAKADAAKEHEERMKAERGRMEMAMITAPSTKPAMTMAPDAPTAPAKLRAKLLGQLKALIETHDTPRGLVMALADADFNQGMLNGMPRGVLVKAAKVLAGTGLRVTVEGTAENEKDKDVAAKRAEAVRRALVSAGLPADKVTSSLVGKMETAMESHHLEVVVSGPEIVDTAPSMPAK